MTELSGDSYEPRTWFVRAIVLGLFAGLLLVLGTYFIYAFGAGYLGAFSVPTPLNFLLAPVLFVGMLLAVGRFVARRL